ncbi:hypothetical protein [Brevibacillus sp. SAFN-007a]|uniref:hypothetical protein n=1 Tax=Brevibacillus sp. SAFN-007a TaxID=3436862 RepID=UPI003F7E2157
MKPLETVPRDLFDFRGALSTGNAGPNTEGLFSIVIVRVRKSQGRSEVAPSIRAPMEAEARYKKIADGSAWTTATRYVTADLINGSRRQKHPTQTDDTAKPLNNPVKPSPPFTPMLGENRGLLAQ